MDDILLALANEYLLHKFEKIPEIENERFEIEGNSSGSKILKMKAEIDLGVPDSNMSDAELQKEVDHWTEVKNKVRTKAREIENDFDGDSIIYTFVDRKRY